jgi:hypothetical protein
MAKPKQRIFSNLTERFNETINGKYGQIDRNKANRNPTGRGLQIIGKPFQFGAINGGKEPYVWYTPDDSNRTGARYDTRRFPFASGRRDALRLTAFGTSARGVSWALNEANLQASNAYSETRIFNPLFIGEVAARSATGNILARPTRSFPPSGGVIGSVLSFFGKNSNDSNDPPGGTTGRPSLPTHYTDGGKGLQRLDTARGGRGRLESIWKQQNSNTKTGLFSQIKSKLKKAFPIAGLFTSAGGPDWEYRGDEHAYDLMFENFKKQHENSRLRQPKDRAAWMNYQSDGTNTQGKFFVHFANNKLYSSGQSQSEFFNFQVQGNYLDTLQQIGTTSGSSPEAQGSFLAAAFERFRKGNIKKSVDFTKDETKEFKTGIGGRTKLTMNYAVEAEDGSGNMLVQFQPVAFGGAELSPLASTKVSFDSSGKYIDTLLNRDGESEFGSLLTAVDKKFIEDHIDGSSVAMPDVDNRAAGISNYQAKLKEALAKLGETVKDPKETGIWQYRTLEELRGVRKGQPNNKINPPDGYYEKYKSAETGFAPDTLESQNRQQGKGFPDFGSSAPLSRRDAINTTGILDDSEGSSQKQLIQDLETIDLIPFFFKDLVNKTRIFFRATVTGMSESNSAEWNETRYLGRADKIYNYVGYDRSLSFSFKVYANSVHEMLPMYEKVNYLVNFTKPGANRLLQTKQGDQQFENSIIVPPYCELTIGDMYQRQPVVINSVNVTVPDDSPWELLNYETHDFKQFTIFNDARSRRVPMILDVSVDCKILEKRIPSAATPNFESFWSNNGRDVAEMKLRNDKGFNALPLNSPSSKQNSQGAGSKVLGRVEPLKGVAESTTDSTPPNTN